jgi:putative transcriptional regulator
MAGPKEDANLENEMKVRKAAKPGSRILQGAREALALARGEADEKAYRIHVPAAIDVRALRRKLRLSQGQFARRFGFTAARIRDWEQGRSRPDGAVRAYLLVIERAPDAVAKALAAA